MAKRRLATFWPDRTRKFGNSQNLFNIPKSMFTSKMLRYLQQVTLARNILMKFAKTDTPLYSDASFKK